MVWLFVCPQDLHAGILKPNVMVLGCGASGRWLSQEGETLVNGISTLTQDPTELPSSFCHVKMKEVCAIEEALHLTMLASWSWTAAKLWEKDFYCF